MKKGFFSAPLLALCCVIGEACFCAELEDAYVSNPRNGLPNVGAKLASGKDVNIVFIGGSITFGGGENGYVQTTERWLKEKYPNAKIKVFNAGINGTDSNFGAKRYDRDVLAYNPDLVLIEFAVNDGQMDATQHMERMIHKTWLKNPETDIVIFYTLAKAHLEDYKNGKLPIAASFHERVAKHYGIPTIGLAYVVARKINNGEIIWEQFSNDSCHPNSNGYKFFNETLQQELPKLFAAGNPGPHDLKSPLTPNLQVYPPAIKTAPVEVKEFVDKDGKKALASYSLPIPGYNWIKDPNFQDDNGKTLWRLHWIDKKKTAPMIPTIGLNKNDWGKNLMIWFEEDKCFTGPEGNSLFSLRPENKANLGFSGTESAVLVFIAPETGTYEFKASADKLYTWQCEEMEFSLNVAQFKWGEQKGKSVAHYKAKRKDVKPFCLEGKVDMVAGEELALIVGTDSPLHIRGGWDNIRFDIGYMGK